MACIKNCENIAYSHVFTVPNLKSSVDFSEGIYKLYIDLQQRFRSNQAVISYANICLFVRLLSSDQAARLA